MFVTMSHREWGVDQQSALGITLVAIVSQLVHFSQRDQFWLGMVLMQNRSHLRHRWSPILNTMVFTGSGTFVVSRPDVFHVWLLIVGFQPAVV
jgi:hypothetical protein